MRRSRPAFWPWPSDFSCSLLTLLLVGGAAGRRQHAARLRRHAGGGLALASSLFHFNRDAAWDDWALYFSSYALGATTWWAAQPGSALMLDGSGPSAGAGGRFPAAHRRWFWRWLRCWAWRCAGALERWPDLRPVALPSRISTPSSWCTSGYRWSARPSEHWFRSSGAALALAIGWCASIAAAGAGAATAAGQAAGQRRPAERLRFGSSALTHHHADECGHAGAACLRAAQRQLRSSTISAAAKALAQHLLGVEVRRCAAVPAAAVLQLARRVALQHQQAAAGVVLANRRAHRRIGELDEDRGDQVVYTTRPAARRRRPRREIHRHAVRRASECAPWRRRARRCRRRSTCRPCCASQTLLRFSPSATHSAAAAWQAEQPGPQVVVGCLPKRSSSPAWHGSHRGGVAEGGVGAHG